MKFLLTGLLWAAIHGGLLAQASTVSLPVNVSKAAAPDLTERPGRLAHRSGYQLMAELGAGVFTGPTFNNSLKAEVINGFWLGSTVYGGIGTGIRLITQESSFWGTFNYPVVPFYLDTRLYASQGNVSPYLAMDVGYSYDLSNGIKGMGMMFNPMAGLGLARHQKTPVYLEVGYHSQMIRNYQDELIKTDKAFGALVVDVGLEF
jgi:hypothetical protein